MSIRTRTRGSESSVGNGNYQIDLTGLWAGGSYPDVNESLANLGDYVCDVETMVDAIDGTRNMHSVNHLHRKVGISSSSSSWRLRDTLTGATADHSAYLTVARTLADQSGPLSVPDGMSIAQSRVPLYSREMVNGLVSLYEVGDIRRAFQAIPVHLMWACFRYVTNVADKRGIWNAGQDFLYELRKIMKVNRGATFAEWAVAVFKFLSGISLAWKFGWKPLLADIQKTSSALGKWQANIDRVLSREFSCVGSHTVTVSAREPGFGLNRLGQFRFDVTCDRTTQATYIAGVKRKLNPDLTALDGLHRAILFESLGMRASLAKAWEVVPWSFVWDWVIPIGTFLEQFGSIGSSQTRVVDGAKWETVKSITKCRAEGKVTITHPIDSRYKLENSLLTAHVGNAERRSYIRTVGASWSTPPVYIPDTKLPDLWAWWTASELAIQKMNVSSRRRSGKA